MSKARKRKTGTQETEQKGQRTGHRRAEHRWGRRVMGWGWGGVCRRKCNPQNQLMCPPGAWKRIFRDLKITVGVWKLRVSQT